MTCKEYFETQMKPNGWVEEDYSYVLHFKGNEYGEPLELYIDKGAMRDPYLCCVYKPYICDQLVKEILAAKVHNRTLRELSK